MTRMIDGGVRRCIAEKGVWVGFFCLLSSVNKIVAAKK